MFRSFYPLFAVSADINVELHHKEFTNNTRFNVKYDGDAILKQHPMTVDEAMLVMAAKYNCKKHPIMIGL